MPPNPFMIVGAHSIIYSKDPESDRAFFRDVLRFPSVDVGDGWLIFGLPPAELAIHPTRGDTGMELYLMCDDVHKLAVELKNRDISCEPIQEQSYGLMTRLTLPSGAMLGVYEPRHVRPTPVEQKRTRAQTKKSKTKRR
jgi:hypothetical protein